VETAASEATAGEAAASEAAATTSAQQFQIVSPRAGDRYEIPPGMDTRYATVALRVATAPGDVVRWFIDGRPVSGSRWILTPGVHMARAVTASGHSDEARF